MNIFTNFKALAKNLRNRKSPAAMINQRNIPPVLGTSDFLLAYESSPWVRATAGKVAQSVGETKWKLVRRDTDKEIDRQHLMYQTLRRPNELMSGTSLFRVTQLSLDLTGDAFWFLERNGLGAPIKYWPIPAHWVADLPMLQRPSFRLSYKAWQAEIPETEMIWIHEASPHNPYGRGHGIMQALADEVSADEFASKHVGQLFFNRASPEFVLMDKEATDVELDVHEHAWNSRLRGLYKAMKPYFTNRTLEFWQPAQQNLENLTLVPLRLFERDIQLQTWGIPPEQLGITTSSNRATAETSDYIFESRVVRPRRTFLAEELSLKLAPMYDERIEVSFFDTSPRDKEHALKVMIANPSAFTINEWREQAKAEPLSEEFGKARKVMLSDYYTVDPMDTESRPGQPGMATPVSSDDEEVKPDEPEEPKPKPKKPKPVISLRKPKT